MSRLCFPSFVTPNLNHRGHRVSQRQRHRGKPRKKLLCRVPNLDLTVRTNVHLTLRRYLEGCLCSDMNQCWKVSICILLLNFTAIAATKPHLVALGRWTSISLRNQD